MRPVKGQIFQKFGAKWIADRDMVLANGLQVKKGDDVYKKFFNLDGHNGWDMFAVLGEPIVAAFDGFIIEQTGKPTGYGNRISQRVGVGGKFYMVIYGHLQKFATDQQIDWNWEDKSYFAKEGQVIGYANSTGASSGTHLHFGVYETNKNGGYLYPLNGYGGCIDPLPLMTKTMTNSKLVQIGNELGYWFPAITGDGLKSQAANVGKTLPEKPDGSVDFSKIVPDYKISE